MNTQTTPSPPYIPTRTWKVAAVTGTGAFMAMLDSTVLNLALESIRADLSSTLPVVQWIANGYLVALCISLTVAAWLGSRYGYGQVWAWGLAAFSFASAFCALAPTVSVLIGARILQGLAGGLMVPAGQAIIGSTAGPKQLGRIMGVLGFVVALGPAIGPAMGGVLLDITSWRLLFWINIPIGIVALIAARGLLPSGSTKTYRPLDRRGLVLIGAGLPLLLYGGTEIGATGVRATTTLAVVIGAALTIGFVLNSRWTSVPLIDVRLLRRKTFAVASAITGCTGVNMYGGLLLLPLYLQVIAGMDRAEIGFLLFSMGLGSAFALPIGGVLTDRYGAGLVSLTGAVLLLVTTIPFLFPSMLTPSVLVLILVTRGVGLALGQMPAMTAAYTSVRAEEMGDASTLVNIVQRIGGVLGAGGVVIILAQAGGRTSSSAYILGFGALTIISAFTVIVAAVLQKQVVTQGHSYPAGEYNR